MLDEVYRSEVLPFTRCVDISGGHFEELCEAPRIYSEDVQQIISLFQTPVVTPVAENVIKLPCLLRTNYGGGAVVKMFTFDGVTGEALEPAVLTAPGLQAITKAVVSANGTLYALYTTLHIVSLDKETLAATTIDYEPEHFSESGEDVVIVKSFTFDEFSDLAIMQTSEDYNTEISVHVLSTGVLVRKVFVCGMVEDIAFESTGRCYVAHTNGVVSVVDYVKGIVFGVLKAPGITDLLTTVIAWDSVYKRLLVVTRTPADTDGASTVRVHGYANLPVATNLTPPLPTRTPRLGRFVPVIVRAYGGAGEPVPAQSVFTLIQPDETLLSPQVSATDIHGYATFHLNCAEEGEVQVTAAGIAGEAFTPYVIPVPPINPIPPPQGGGGPLIVGLGVQQHSGTFDAVGQAFTQDLRPDSIRVAFNHGDYEYGVNWAADRGIGVLFFLGYSAGCDPTTPSGRQCYADRSADLAVQFGDKVQFYEVWNEWNGGLGLGVPFNQFPANSPSTYADLLQRTYMAIKAVRPTAIVVGGVTATADISWLDGMYDAGAGDFMDMVSVHPYVYVGTGPFKLTNYLTPAFDGASKFLEAVNAVHNLGVSKTGRSIPILVSEEGRIDGSFGGSTAVNEHLTSDYCRVLYERVRVEAPFVRGIWWFDLKNSFEGNWGLVRADNTKKPAFARFQAQAAL